MAVDLGAELQRLAREAGARGARVQHRPAVAQAGDAFAVKHVGVDACGLRGAVGAHAERPAAHLVDQLEGLQVEGVTGAREQRLDVLEQRRDDELETVAAGRVEQAAPQHFHVARPVGQDIGDVLRQEPGRGHAGMPAT